MEEFQNIRDNVEKAILPRAEQEHLDDDFDSISHYSKISVNRQARPKETIN